MRSPLSALSSAAVVALALLRMTEAQQWQQPVNISMCNWSGLRGMFRQPPSYQPRDRAPVLTVISRGDSQCHLPGRRFAVVAKVSRRLRATGSSGILTTRTRQWILRRDLRYPPE